MRKIIIDSMEKTVGNVIRIDMLVEVECEFQHRYISVDLLSTQREKINAMSDYVKTLTFKNLSDEEQENHIKAFKGGRL